MRLADFIYCLESQGMGLIDIQSDQALELLNDCLPKNMLIARIPTKEKDNDAPDVSQEHNSERR